MNHVHARIIGKLALQIARKRLGRVRIKASIESASIRRASSRECTPSPGPYSAITRGWLKSILPATRSTSVFELGMIEAI